MLFSLGLHESGPAWMRSEINPKIPVVDETKLLGGPNSTNKTYNAMSLITYIYYKSNVFLSDTAAPRKAGIIGILGALKVVIIKPRHKNVLGS